MSNCSLIYEHKVSLTSSIKFVCWNSITKPFIESHFSSWALDLPPRLQLKTSIFFFFSFLHKWRYCLISLNRFRRYIWRFTFSYYCSWFKLAGNLTQLLSNLSHDGDVANLHISEFVFKPVNIHMESSQFVCLYFLKVFVPVTFSWLLNNSVGGWVCWLVVPSIFVIGLRISPLKPKISPFRPQISLFRPQISPLRPQIWSLGLKISSQPLKQALIHPKLILSALLDPSSTGLCLLWGPQKYQCS